MSSQLGHVAFPLQLRGGQGQGYVLGIFFCEQAGKADLREAFMLCPRYSSLNTKKSSIFCLQTCCINKISMNCASHQT